MLPFFVTAPAPLPWRTVSCQLTLKPSDFLFQVMLGGAWFEQHFGDPNKADEDEIVKVAVNESGKQLMGGMGKPIKTIINIQKVGGIGKYIFIFLADNCPFVGPLVPQFLISGDISSGFQSQTGLPYSHCRGECNIHSLRSPGSTHCLPLDSKHCGAPTRFISCPRILLCGSSES